MYILDIEASGTGGDGYPVEIAWSRVDGSQSFSTLINPDSVNGWDGWNYEGCNHGLTRQECCERGETAAYVARRVSQLLNDYPVFSESPVQDQKWLEKLFIAAGKPCSAQLIPLELAVPPAKRRELSDRLFARRDAHNAAANCLLLSRELQHISEASRSEHRKQNTEALTYKRLKGFSFVT